MILLYDEKNVLRWLTQYGPLQKTQLVKLLNIESLKTCGRILKNLRKSYNVVDLDQGRYYTTDPFARPDPSMITAIWVLIKFANQIDPHAHHPAEIPAQVFFLKENTSYEIIVLQDGEDHLLKLLQPKPDMKYIIVVPDMNIVEKLQLPDAPCLFATVTPNGYEEPEITFYTQEEDSD